jgi:valyl-tRNA synthetase
MVDLDAEITKLTKKLDVATLSVDKLKSQMSQGNYEIAIPENIRAANAEKVRLLLS